LPKLAATIFIVELPKDSNLTKLLKDTRSFRQPSFLIDRMGTGLLK
jgi:hypothetical protein